MNGRTAALTALAAFAALTGSAHAQATPPASPATSRAADEIGPGGGFLSAAEGRVLYASRDYEAGGFGPGPGMMALAASVTTFETDAQALAAYERAGGMLDAIAAAEGLAFTDRAEVSPPDVGERSAAERLTYAETSETALDIALVRAVEGRTLHVWLGAGLGDPSLDLVTLAETAMRFADLDADAADADALALLPALDEMPPGFTADDGRVAR